MRLTPRGRRTVALLAVAAVLASAFAIRATFGGAERASGAAGSEATTSGQPAPHIPRPAWAPATGRPVPEPLTIATESRTRAVVERAARALLSTAPVVVVAPASDPEGMTVGGRLARRLRAPLLPVPSSRGGGPVEADRRAETVPRSTAVLLRDLRTRTLVAVGSARVPGGPFDVRRVRLPVGLRDVRDLLTHADRHRSPAVSDPVTALVRAGDPGGMLAAHVARAAGHEVVELTGPDPRADREAQRRLAEIGGTSYVLLGAGRAWADAEPDELSWQLAVARRGHELPGGGQILFPDRRLVALYGNPEGPALGVLGEQDVDAAIERARAVARPYAGSSDRLVVPTFEIIATVASASPEPTGDWSRRSRRDVLERWVDAAEQAGIYVVLDLQPGTTGFLTQAKELEGLLVRPHVGLALDPEWRLAPGQRHLQQIGSVSAGEVNAVAEWLAELVRTNELPQKLLLVHQFRLSMIRDRSSLDTDHPELAMAIQMDGQGSQGVKLGSWRAVTTVDPPPGIWWGWKNFYDEDPTVRSPTDVLSLEPSPVFISYQ